MVPLSHPCSKDFHYHPAVGVPWSLRSRLWPRRMSKGGQVGHQHDDVPTATCVAPGLPHLSLQVETKAHSREAQPSVASDHSCNKVSQMKVMRERERLYLFSELCFHLFAWIETNMSDCQTCLWPKKNLDKYQGTPCGCNALLQCCSARLQLTHPTFTIEAGLWHRMHGWYIAMPCNWGSFWVFFLGQAL